VTKQTRKPHGQGHDPQPVASSARYSLDAVTAVCTPLTLCSNIPSLRGYGPIDITDPFRAGRNWLRRPSRLAATILCRVRLGRSDSNIRGCPSGNGSALLRGVDQETGRTMRAMLLEKQGSPLQLAELPAPLVGPSQLRLRVKACGLCRTDLHIVDGDLTEPKLPLVPGHQIVGTVERLGDKIEGFQVGERVGVPWLGTTCGHCRYCRDGQENLCDQARYTGYHLDGGLAEYAVADARFCFRLPQGVADVAVAPLLCAGLIGYRSFRMVGAAQRLGFYGFGAAAHLLIQVAISKGREVYAFTRASDSTSQAFARRLGAQWVGASEQRPPRELDAAIIFAPVGALVPLALRAVRKGGTVICAGIHMSDIPSFPYADLWGERVLRSVANLTRQDGEEFLGLVGEIPIHTETSVYSLEQTNQALSDLRRGVVQGAAVIRVE
jgi:alcohol dehydrogenase, propanol-preferring